MTASSQDKPLGAYFRGGVCGMSSAIWLTSGLLMVLPCGITVWLTLALGASHWLLFPLWPDCGLCHFSLVQSLGRVQLFVTPWTAAHQASLSITNSQRLLKLMCSLCRPVLLLPSIFPSIRVFSTLMGIRLTLYPQIIFLPRDVHRLPLGWFSIWAVST